MPTWLGFPHRPVLDNLTSPRRWSLRKRRPNGSSAPRKTSAVGVHAYNTIALAKCKCAATPLVNKARNLSSSRFVFRESNASIRPTSPRSLAPLPLWRRSGPSGRSEFDYRAGTCEPLTAWTSENVYLLGISTSRLRSLTEHIDREMPAW